MNNLKSTVNRNAMWTSVCVTFVCLCGCSGEVLEPTYFVSGTVTQKGKPIEGAIVAFTPATPGLPASGVTNASGIYKLTTRESGDGALVGKYTVTIAKYNQRLEPKPTGSPEKPVDPYDITNEYPAGYNEMQSSEIAASLSKNLLPAKYANPITSKLEAEVKKTKNTCDFKVD